MTTQASQHIHEEHKDWLADITGWHNELMYYDRVLLRLLQKTDKKDDTDKMERFKSEFDNMQQSLTSMREEILEHEKHLNGHPEQANSRHNQVRGEVKNFKRKFQEVKDEFYRFEESNVFW